MFGKGLPPFLFLLWYLYVFGKGLPLSCWLLWYRYVFGKGLPLSCWLLWYRYVFGKGLPLSCWLLWWYLYVFGKGLIPLHTHTHTHTHPQVLQSAFARCVGVLSQSSLPEDMAVQVCTHICRCYRVSAQFEKCREAITEVSDVIRDVCRVLYFKVSIIIIMVTLYTCVHCIL